MDALFAILESASREETDMPTSLHSAHVQMAEPHGYPGVGVIRFPRRDLRFVGDEHMPRIRVNHELGVEAHLRQQC